MSRKVIDPTKNVEQLVREATKRQDDLREAESRHIREVADLRAHHGEQLREAEAARIDAIRQVDVEAVQRAAEVQATQQRVLADQVAAAAEAMRTQVAVVASASASALTAALEPIVTDVADLRRSQYEAQGQKTQVVETHQKAGNLGQWVAIAISITVALIVLVGTVVTIALGG